MEMMVGAMIKRISFWPKVGLIFGVSMAVSLLALRANNQNMVNLRDALIKADKSGDTGKVEIAAKNLQHYVAAHMNTDTGRVALQASYNKAAEAAMEAAKPAEIDSTVYQTAADNCRPQLTNYGYRAWASCVSDAVGTNSSVSVVTAEEVAPDPDLYYVDYASPQWSNDLAGWSIIIAIVSGMMLIYKGLSLLVKYLKNRLSIALKH